MDWIFNRSLFRIRCGAEMAENGDFRPFVRSSFLDFSHSFVL